MPVQSEAFCNQYINTNDVGWLDSTKWLDVLCIGDGRARVSKRAMLLHYVYPQMQWSRNISCLKLNSSPP